MADTKITGLPANTAPVGVDLFCMVDDVAGTPTTVKVTGANAGKAIDAGTIPNTPSGAIAATDIQAAIDELEAEKSPLAGGTDIVTTGALDAGSITSNFGAIDNGSSTISGGDIDGTSGTFTAANALFLGTSGALGGAATFYNSSNANTGKLQIGANTGNRIAILPDATDTLVGKATTDTLTNKTIDANGTGNSISNIDIADLANGTDGELITWDAAGAPAAVAVGTSGHVLTSNGVGAAPTFQAAGGGGGGGLDLYFGGQQGELVVGSIERRFVSGTATASAFKCTLEVAGTGSTQVVTLYKNGASEAVCTFTDGQAAAANGLVVQDDATLTSGSYAENDLLEVKVTTIGSTTPGTGLQWSIIV